MTAWGWHLCVENLAVYIYIYIYIYIYVKKGVSHNTYCGWYIDCCLNSHCFTVPLKLPHINIGPQLYMMSPLPIHLVLSIVQCSTAVCTFVTCGSGWCDQFTGCAEWRMDRCEYPYCGRYVDCLTETYYAIVLCKQKTLLKIFLTAWMAFGSSIDIPAYQ
jgi:hypothetical protein